MSDDSPFNRGSRIDRAIDRAVHEIVQRDPPPGLRRRVLARIERPARAAWIPRLAVAAVAMAAIAIVTTSLRPQPAPPAPRPESVTASAPAPAPDVAPGRARPLPVGETPVTSPRRPRATDTLIPMPPVRNVFAAQPVHAAGASIDTWQMAALSDTAPAMNAAAGAERLGPLTPSALRTGAITIAPLEIEQLHIVPLRK